jgi:hypothetical protein
MYEVQISLEMLFGQSRFEMSPSGAIDGTVL